MSNFNFTFQLPADASLALREAVEDAEDSRSVALKDIEATCKRLGVGAKLFATWGYAGMVEASGNSFLE